MNRTHRLLFALIVFCMPVDFFGQSSRPPRLIVRGDDMGFTQSANEALLAASLKGIQTSIEIMPNTPWFPQAVEMLKKHPTIDIGVHLTLTSEWENLKWRPLTHAPSLVDSNGYFYPFIWPNKDYPQQHLTEKNWDIKEIEQEFRAQIEIVLKHLPWTSHLSAHMGCTALSKEVSDLANRLGEEYKLNIDLKALGVEGIGYKGPKKTMEEKKKAFLAMLKTLQPNKTYLFVDHPALDSPELRAIKHIGYEGVSEDRQGVTDIFTSKEIKDEINRLGIQLISYKDLKK